MAKKKPKAPNGRLVAEFVLVVLGVMVALTVDTWIEQRNDDQLRQDYLTRLADDLEADKKGLDYRISFFSSIRAFGLQTLTHLQSGQAVDQSALLAAYYASENFSFRPIENTYKDLQSTGNIRLLGDIELRLALASYYTMMVNVGADYSVAYREVVRGIIPWKIQAAIREHCPTTVDFDVAPTKFSPCMVPGITEEDVNTVFESLRAFPRIAEILTYHVSQLDVSVYLYRARKDRLLDVLAQL